MTTTDRRRLFLRADGLFAVPGAEGDGGDGGTPDPHAETHADGGSDEIAIAQSQVIGLEVALAGKPDTGDPPSAHHTTHEPGGADALTALDASTLTTGTVPDARLSGNVAVENAPNVFTANQIIATNFPALVLTDPQQPPDARVFSIVGTAQTLRFDATTDAYAVVASPLSLIRGGDVKVQRDVYEKGRVVPMGHWIDVPFNAANFTASAGGTWTVTAGNVTTFGYCLIGKTAIVSIYLELTTITGTPVFLYIQLPIGITGSFGQPFHYYGPPTGTGVVLTGSGNQLQLLRDVGGTAWQPAANVYIALTFPVRLS